jgi:uncharacterized protein YcaQ
VLPAWQDHLLPTTEEKRRELALKAVKALGITTARWVSDYFRTDKRQTILTVSELAREKALMAVEVEGWTETAFVHTDNRKLLKQAAANKIEPVLTTLLSPFDPLVWDRARARAMFGFDYKLECYTPAPKRVYGYFTLPILRRGALVGRLDAKAHRKDGVFEIKSIHLEAGTRADDEMTGDIAAAILECAGWHKTPDVIVRESAPKGFAKQLGKHLPRRRGGAKKSTQA